MGMPPYVVWKEKIGHNSWVRYLNRRVMKQNKNNMIEVLGPTGSGKSLFGLYLAEELSKSSGVPFGIDNVVFGLTELFELINSGELKRGSVIMFDEPQISISAKEFQSKANKVFNSLITTFRHLGYTLIFCTPYSELLDKSSRRLFHIRFTIDKINYSDSTVKVIPRFLEHSLTKDKTYFKRLMIGLRKNRQVTFRPLDIWIAGKASEDLIDAYEKKKIAFTTVLNKNLFEDLIESEKKKPSLTKERVKEDELDLTKLKSSKWQRLIWKTLTTMKVKNQKELIDIMERDLQSGGVRIDQGQLSKTLISMNKKGFPVYSYMINDDRE